MFIKNKSNITGKEYLLDTPADQQSFLQFIPATVRQIINSGEASASPTNNNNESNCIAIEKSTNTNNANIEGMETKKYRPLLRGFSDSIVKGDSVLVTVVGDVGYYLGPLNNTNTPSQTSSTIRGSGGTLDKKLHGTLPRKVKSKTYPYESKFNRHFK